VLTSALCLTRPPGNPVPPGAARGADGGNLCLVRIRNDEARDWLKIAVETAMRGLDLDAVADLARARAAELDAELGLPLDENKITQFMFALPVQATAQLLGIPRERYRDMMSWLGDYGVATASAATGVPAPDAALFARGNHAAQALIDLVGALRKNSGARGQCSKRWCRRHGAPAATTTRTSSPTRSDICFRVTPPPLR
jgi:cytochrome P450